MPTKKLRLKRLLPTLAIAIAAASASVACSSADASGPNGVVSLRYQGWTDQVLLPELAQDLGYFHNKIKLNWVGNTISGPQDIQSAATGQTDFGGAFAGAVAKLITAGAPITAVINYYGYDHKTFTGFYVPNNSSIHTAADLVGKKVGVNTLGGQDEADIHDYLRKAGLSEDQVKKVQLVALPPPNTEDALRHGQIDVAALSGQFQQRAVADGGVRAVFTDIQEYGPFNGGPYVFRNDFIAQASGRGTHLRRRRGEGDRVGARHPAREGDRRVHQDHRGAPPARTRTPRRSSTGSASASPPRAA